MVAMIYRCPICARVCKENLQLGSPCGPACVNTTVEPTFLSRSPDLFVKSLVLYPSFSGQNARGYGKELEPATIGKRQGVKYKIIAMRRHPDLSRGRMEQLNDRALGLE